MQSEQVANESPFSEHWEAWHSDHAVRLLTIEGLRALDPCGEHQHLALFAARAGENREEGRYAAKLRTKVGCDHGKSHIMLALFPALWTLA
jgi:hypothetical protein